MWITRFITYLSIAFHIYLLIIIHFELIIIKIVKITVERGDEFLVAVPQIFDRV
jgi:hypothetical protein